MTRVYHTLTKWQVLMAASFLWLFTMAGLNWVQDAEIAKARAIVEQVLQ